MDLSCFEYFWGPLEKAVFAGLHSFWCCRSYLLRNGQKRDDDEVVNHVQKGSGIFPNEDAEDLGIELGGYLACLRKVTPRVKTRPSKQQARTGHPEDIDELKIGRATRPPL